MRTVMLGLLLLVLAAAPAAGQNAANVPSGAKLPALSSSTTTIFGKVVDADGRPVAGAEVVAWGRRSFPGQKSRLERLTETTSQPDGAFSISFDSSAGALTLLARKAGLSIGWTCRQPPKGTAQEIIIALVAPAVLSGTVVDEQGRPLSGVEVRALLHQQRDDPHTGWPYLGSNTGLDWTVTHTNDRGEFALQDMPADVTAEYILKAPGRACLFTPKLTGRGPTPPQCLFRPGQTDIRITLSVESRLEGVVVDKSTGRPLPGIDLSIQANGQPIYAKTEAVSGPDVPSGAKPVGAAEDAWRTRFDAVYNLKDGEVLKRIAPPFIPEREDFRWATFAEKNQPPPNSMGFRWTGKLEYDSEVWSSGRPLIFVLMDLLHVSIDEFDGSQDLLNMDAPGDWIVRDGATREEIFGALEKILEKSSWDVKFHFTKRLVERDVIVAEGRFQLQPLPEVGKRKEICFFSDKLKLDSGGGGGYGVTVAKILETLGSRTGRKVIDSTEANTIKDLSYLTPDSSYLIGLSGEEYQRKLKLLLDNLARQTGLTFRQERRQVQVWFVSAEDTFSPAPRSDAAPTVKPPPAGK